MNKLFYPSGKLSISKRYFTNETFIEKYKLTGAKMRCMMAIDLMDFFTYNNQVW